MKSILENPYRITGLLVGATAREQERQVKRLKQFIEADQDPEEDFSFPSLGNIHRTVEKVENAASKLTLDNDKINAALFWFYKGNAITDEPAFDALKEANHEESINIWSKLTANGEVNQRNSSAFHNLSIIYLCNAINGSTIKTDLLETGISLKLKFLESELIKDFKSIATDETYKTTKKELQLLFLNQIYTEVENNGSINSQDFIKIINKQEFIAKEDFLKGFIQKPIEQIEKKIDEAKKKRKENPSTADKTGNALYNEVASELAILKNILGTTNLKYSSIADKVANEILQCSIDYFNDCQEKDSNADYAETAMKLSKQAEILAVGNITKGRVKDSIDTLEEMKDRVLLQAIAVLQSIKDAYEEACRQINKQVDELQYDTFPSIGGSAPMRIPKFNVSINWSKVEEMKRNCLAWDKVTEVILDAIPLQNIDKIRRASNSTKVNEYMTLVNFLMSKINYSFKSRIAYINYWETPRTTCSSSTSTSTSRPTTSSTNSSTSTSRPTSSSSSNSQSEFNFFANAWWIFGLIGLFIGVALAGGAGALGGGILGASLGSRMSKW